jgi:cysteine synthase
MHIARDLTELIGRTPALALGRLFPNTTARVYAKLEMHNPMSIKDRPVLNMIRNAMTNGLLGPETEVVEASSGNTAIAIAALSTILNFKVRIYMSDLCSDERRKILCAYGATVVITPGAEHTRGARDRAMAYCDEHPDSTLFLNQHGNPDNGRAHELTTGPEIWEQFGSDLKAVVIGLGTCGTFDGVSRYLKSKNPNIHIAAFEPASSPVYSGGAQGKHKITGIGPGFITDNFKRSQHHMDELLTVPDDAAWEWTRRIARVEGILTGITSGAAAWAVGQLADRDVFRGGAALCFFYDTGERYLSTPDLFPMDTVEYCR